MLQTSVAKLFAESGFYMTDHVLSTSLLFCGVYISQELDFLKKLFSQKRQSEMFSELRIPFTTIT